MKGSYYNWIFYYVETQNKVSDSLIKSEGYTTIEEAQEYIKRMLKTKSLDYNEKLVLIKREYNPNEDLIDEETLKEYDYKGEIKC